MPSPELIGALASKALGALLGAFFALVFLPPKTRTEFISRAAVTFIAGIVFAPSVMYYTSWPMDHDYLIAAAAVAGFTSWWGMGAVIKAARGWTPK